MALPEKEEVTPPPVPPPTAAEPQTAPAAIDPLAAFQAQADKALERIAAAARSPAMKGDPYRENFIAQASVVELMPELVRLIHAGRAPLSDDATAALVALVGEKVDQRVKRESGRLYRAFDRRTNAVIAGAIGGAFVLGCLIGFATAFRLLAG
ncbi:MAG: hypothetical protein EON48_07565 [Acetobacteraceae bacterium]|nr:MAG: hypothetical protein EON48_07565 [Acetobacteraceae bacterium]